MESFAHDIAPLFDPGDNLLLSGPIGSGKSVFARAFMRARLGDRGKNEDMPSPTYTLVQTYEADGYDIWHADLYRLTSVREVTELGLEQAFDSAICLVEWPEILGKLEPRNAIWLTFSIPPEDDSQRNLQVQSRGKFAGARAQARMDRDQQLTRFIADSGWGGATRLNLAGDASFRRYERLVRAVTGDCCVLMDAPVSSCGPLAPFLKVTSFLRQLKLSAPFIIASDEHKGLLLLEDLGDDLFARVAVRDPGAETQMYEVAIDLLVEIASHPVPDDLPDYSPGMQSELAAMSLEWYLSGISGEPAERQLVTTLRNLIEELIGELNGPGVFAHRDYHAENLLWLPQRSGLARIGLLDYQDGAIANRAYDLVSLIEDARRDLAPGLREYLLRRYSDLAGVSEAELERQVAICGAQRNLRILGIFARLAIRDGKTDYINLLPRVWQHLAKDLAHPDLARLREFVERCLPAPETPILQRLREAAA